MRSTQPEPDRTEEVADAVAASWATRLDGGSMTFAEEQALAAWLAEDVRNTARLDAYRRIYGRLGATVPRLVDSGRMADPLRQSLPGVVRPRFVAWRPVAVGLAAAAAVTLAAHWWTGRPQTLATTVGNRQVIMLADGSNVDLNARTSLSVRMRGTERHVDLLEGEAFFSVVKDSNRPFIVETPAGAVRVVGTAFNVRSYGAGNLEVTVVEGAVHVAPTGVAGQPASQHREHFLSPDDQLTVAGTRSELRHLPEGAARDLVAWREGRLILESERLAAAVERFARYHGRAITVSPEIAALELGGRFRLDELDNFLRDLTAILPVIILRSGDGSIRVIPRVQ